MIHPGPLSAMTTLCLAVALVAARADDPKNKAADAPAPEAARKAIERGLAFLQTDAADWRKEHKCASCHHGTMTVWAFSEARGRGYAIDDATYRDAVSWTKERLANIDQPRDTRPGYSMVNTPAVYLAAMAIALPTRPTKNRPPTRWPRRGSSSRPTGTSSASTPPVSRTRASTTVARGGAASVRSFGA